MAGGDTFIGVRIPSSVARSSVICGTVQMCAFCAQNLLQEHVTAAAILAEARVGLLYTLSELVFCAFVPFIELMYSAKGRRSLSELLDLSEPPSPPPTHPPHPSIFVVNDCCLNPVKMNPQKSWWSTLA
jgi:hypothetical protein